MTTTAPVSLDAPLDELVGYASERYDVRFEPVSVGERTLEVLQIADLSSYLERLAEAAGDAGELDLPLWARIWPSSMVLAHLVSGMNPPQGVSALEIGAGVGVCGLFAAAAGFETVITDVCHDALVFAKASVLHNGLQDRAEVRRADFAADRLNRRFDVILGSEVLYSEKLHRGLVKFLTAHTRPSASSQVLLSRDYCRKAVRFFKLAEEHFNLSNKTVGCKHDEQGQASERYLCDVLRLTPRKVR